MPITLPNGQIQYSGGEALPPVNPAPTLASRYVPVAAANAPRTVDDNLKEQGSTFTQARTDQNLEDSVGASLREQSRSDAQGTIDAIKSTFDKYISDDTDAKKSLETKAYLSALANGQAGSGAGGAKEKAAADRGQKQVQTDTQERDAQIAAALSNADTRASTEFNTRRTQYLNSVKDATTAQKDLDAKVKTEAEGEISAYAGAMSYDEWAAKVGPAKVQQYMKETGRDADGIQALFLKGAKNDLVDASGTKLSDGSVVFMKKVYDANGNLTGTKEVGRIQGAGGKTIKDARLTDNGVQILYNDGTYEERGADGSPTAPGSSGSSKPITGTPTGFTQDDIQKGSDLLKQYGTGGYASPAFYVDAYQNWINKGGTAAKFLQLYPPDDFVSPADADNVPTYLQPKKAKPAAAAPTTTTASASGGRSY